MTRFCCILAFMLLVAGLAFGQCELPKSQFEQAPNMFTPEQEIALGDVIFEQLQQRLHLIKDDELNRYPNGIAKRLLQSAPSSPFNYRIQIIDEPYTNAFSTSGGRIYVTRKSVLLAKNEDELAGLLAHEISHVYTRQMGADFTHLFQGVLGINQLGDKADIAKRYHQILDTWAKKSMSFNRKHSDQEQLVADQTAIYLMALAGYRPAAFGEYFDRLAETQGKTGSFWSDFFGSTAPESKRLRAIGGTVSALPPACIGATKPAEQKFQSWKEQLIRWSGPALKTSVRDVVAQKKLEPPLLSNISRLEFSPDGRYILAQDDSTVNILTREPFAFLFRIPLPNHALPARFSPDGQSVVVGSRSGRVEKWNLISMQRTAVYELATLKQCKQSSLSPDGNSMGCLRIDNTLALYDVKSGETLYEKKEFYQPSFWALFTALMAIEEGVSVRYIDLDFSDDGRYFAATSSQLAVAFDIPNKAPVQLSGSLKGAMLGWFRFAGSDRVLAKKDDQQELQVLEFPSGKLVTKFKVGLGMGRMVTKGNVFVVAPVQNFAIGLYDADMSKFVIAMKSQAFDMYGKQYVAELQNGTLLLADRDDKDWGSNSHRVQLPTPQLGNITTLSVSDDLHWMAVSQVTRGGIFDLDQGVRKDYYRNFMGAWFDSEQQMWADFPKYDKDERTIACFDTPTSRVISHRQIKPEVSGHIHGRYFVSFRMEKGVTKLEIRDVKSDALVWTRDVKDFVHISSDGVAGTLVLRWAASAGPAKSAAHDDAKLGQQLNQIKDKDKSYYLEVYELSTGKPLGHIAIDTGKASFTVANIQATPDFLAMKDSEERIHLYNLSTGEQIGAVFGDEFDLSRKDLLMVLTGENRIEVFDAKTLDTIDKYEFESAVAATRFVADGSKLVVLTRNQTAFVLQPRAHAADAMEAAAK